MTLLLCFFLFPLGFVSLGHLILSRLHPAQNKNDALALICKFSIGLIIYSYYWFGMSLITTLNHGAILIYLTASMIAIFFSRGFWKESLSIAKSIVYNSWRESIWGKSALILILVSLLATFVRCWGSYIEGDSLVYHLFLPKQFALRGGFWEVPYSEHLFWPLFSEIGFIPGEILKSLALSKFITFQVFACFCLLIAVTIKALTQNHMAAILCTLAFATSPVFFFHAPSTYNDIYFAFFLVLSLVLIVLKQKSGFAQTLTYGLSGLFLGAALANKYTALYGAIALIPILFTSLAGEWKTPHKMAKHLFFFCLAAFISGSPYYLRAFIQYGNPVFPFAQSLFQTPFGHGLTEAGLVGSNVSGFNSGTGRSLLDFLLLIWNLTFYPNSFGGDKLGYMFLALAPLSLLAFKKNFGLFIYLVIYTLIWFLLSQYNRYLLPALSALLFLSGIGVALIIEKQPRFKSLVFAILIALGLAHTTWPIYHAHKDFFKRVPENIIPIAQWINKIIPSSREKVMTIDDERLYYYDFAAFRESTFRNFTSYPDFLDTQETVKLLDREDVGYLLIASYPKNPQTQSFQPAHYFQNLSKAGYYDPIGRHVSAYGTTYTLYKRSSYSTDSSHLETPKKP